MPRPLPLSGGSVVDVDTGSVGVRPVLVRDGRIDATRQRLTTDWRAA